MSFLVGLKPYLYAAVAALAVARWPRGVQVQQRGNRVAQGSEQDPSGAG